MKLIANHLNNAILAVMVGFFVLWGLFYPGDFEPRDVRAPLPLSERQMLARTLLGECGRCGDNEVRWIAHTIFNRLRSGRYGEEIADVVTYKRRGIFHFSVWDRRHRHEATGAHVDRSAAFARMLRLGDAAWQEERDPTGGAVNFFHPGSMKPIGSQPKWAKGRIGVRVGGAIFYR